jgi:hypothetical protein
MSTEVRATRLSEMSIQTPERPAAAPAFARIGIQAVAAAADQLKRAEAEARARAAVRRELPAVLREIEAL